MSFRSNAGTFPIAPDRLPTLDASIFVCFVLASLPGPDNFPERHGGHLFRVANEQLGTVNGSSSLQARRRQSENRMSDGSLPDETGPVAKALGSQCLSSGSESPRKSERNRESRQ